MRVRSLGWTPVKGTGWHEEQELGFTLHGADGDRLWTPVDTDLRAVKATDLPEFAGVHLALDELPGPDEHLVAPQARTVAYYRRRSTALVHAGPVAQRLSRLAGQELWLARSIDGSRFIWSSPVSVLFTSELADLPTDTGRYRPNIVLDDREWPVAPLPGQRLQVGGLLLEVEHELDRCLVVNHNPRTGLADQSLLRRLRPGVLLGHGCRVLQPGRVRVGDPARLG